jgi:hypothetical protein
LEFGEGGFFVFEGSGWEAEDSRVEKFGSVREGLDLVEETSTK